MTQWESEIQPPDDVPVLCWDGRGMYVAARSLVGAYSGTGYVWHSAGQIMPAPQAWTPLPPPPK
jgi:hypothetical protein